MIGNLIGLWPWAVAFGAPIITVLIIERKRIMTLMHAAKLLPTVKQAIPRYVWPILILAMLVKVLPVDFGIDEALLIIAVALIAWRRPGLLKALYREAEWIHDEAAKSAR